MSPQSFIYKGVTVDIKDVPPTASNIITAKVFMSLQGPGVLTLKNEPMKDAECAITKAKTFIDKWQNIFAKRGGFQPA